MGVVYRAEAEGAEGFTKTVAVKMVHEVLARDPGIRDAFMDEAKVAQRLHHGNIVQIIDLGVEDKTPYMVQEYVDGLSLSELLDASRGGSMPIAAALYVAEMVAAALAYAHGIKNQSGRSEGVVHRDVTPRNILVSRDGVVKLADFGIAKAISAPSYTLPGTIKGSLGYLSPEQAAGQPVDERTDQFSTGIVLHEMLSGNNPIGARDVEAYRRRLEDGVPRLGVREPIDDELADIVARAVALDADDRFESMNDLKAALEAWRVSHEIKISNESLRDTIRLLLGEGATKQARPLGEALKLDVPTAKTALQRPTPLDSKRSRNSSLGLWALVVGVIALIAGVVLFVMAGRGGGETAAANPTADAAPPVAIDAAAQAVAVDAAAPADAADAAALPPDAAPPGPDARPTKIVRPRGNGRLKVNVVPYAKVFVDGKLVGSGRVDAEVPAGKHTLRLENPDLNKKQTRPILIKPGQTVSITDWKD